MNAKLVNSAEGVILAALEQNRTAAGIALALDSAQLLLTPQTTAELKELQDRVAELEAAPAMVYRAEHDCIVMGYYRTPEAARDHCMTVARRDTSHGALEWRTDEPSEEDSPEELWDLGNGPDDEWFGTGYLVTPLEIASKYDPDADE